MLLYSAIGTGCGVLVAQAFGRNDLNDISRVAALSLMSSGIFGLLHGFASHFISRDYSQINRSTRGTGPGRFSLFSAFFCLFQFGGIVSRSALQKSDGTQTEKKAYPVDMQSCVYLTIVIHRSSG